MLTSVQFCRLGISLRNYEVIHNPFIILCFDVRIISDTLFAPKIDKAISDVNTLIYRIVTCTLGRMAFQAENVNEQLAAFIKGS